MKGEARESGATVDFFARRWLPYALFAAVTAVLAVPILNHIANWGIRDWDLFTTLHATAVRSITEYGQFPFWNPYIGGGNILFAHPEVPVLNPLFGLMLLFGPLTGLKVQLLVVYFIGLIGGHKLARHMGMSAYGALVTPVVFMLSAYLSLHFAAGHAPFHYFSAFPWLVLFYKKSLDRPIHVLSAGGVVAFVILGSGAAVPLLFSLTFLFMISLFDIGERHTLKPPLFAAAAGVCGVLFAAVKFFPMFDYLARNPWIPEHTVETTPLSILPTMFLGFNQSVFADHLRGHMWGWHEYGVFVGPAAMLLAVVALAKTFRVARPYLVLIVISLILVAGSFAPPWSPWDLLHRLPGFESIRVPSRFSLLALFAFAVLAGKGTDVVLSWFSSRKNVVFSALFAAVLGAQLAVCLPILGRTFTREPEAPVFHDDFQQAVGDPNSMYVAFLSNRGTIHSAWLSAYHPLGRGILDLNDRPSEWYSDGDAVQVLGRDFTPNRITYRVRTAAGGTLVISQGYDTGWRRTDGGMIRPFEDLVTLVVSPQDRQVEIYYFPDYFVLGLVVSIVSILLALGTVFFVRLRYKAALH